METLTKTSHTPGPWDICESNNSNLIHVETAYCNETVGAGLQICTVNKGNREQRLANANLIAAAPELLEVLEKVESRYAEYGGPVPLWDEIKSVIAKAYGR